VQSWPAPHALPEQQGWPAPPHDWHVPPPHTIPPSHVVPRQQGWSLPPHAREHTVPFPATFSITSPAQHSAASLATTPSLLHAEQVPCRHVSVPQHSAASLHALPVRLQHLSPKHVSSALQHSAVWSLSLVWHACFVATQ